MHAFESTQQNSFSDLLTEAGMVLQLPDGMVNSEIVNNDQMNYEHAVKYPDKKFEIRYSIRPLRDRIERYKENEKNKKPGETFNDPNKMYAASFTAVAYNISGGKFKGSKEFDKNAVKNEFNADWGAMTFVETGTSFGLGYKYCMMLAIHKDDCADAYIFFMTDDKENLMEWVIPVFHSLKFK